MQVKAGNSVLQLVASLLQLRGCHPSSTPLQHQDRQLSSSVQQCCEHSCNQQFDTDSPSAGSVLCYNGEIFGGLSVPPGTCTIPGLQIALSTLPLTGSMSLFFD